MKPHYNTWIKRKKMVLFIVLFCILVLTGLIVPLLVGKLLLLAVAIPFGYISFVLAASYYCFSDKGKEYQGKIHQMIADKIAPEVNSVLDIGAGSGALSIRIAKKSKSVTIQAVDYWGDDWAYSQKQCEENAVLEQVGEQISFLKASASKLPFEDGKFDAVVSCLTFHEVKDTADKGAVVAEALRVVKSGGQFIFFDLFADKNLFGAQQALTEKINACQAEITEISSMKTLYKDCPKVLLLKKVLGNAVLIQGRRR